MQNTFASEYLQSELPAVTVLQELGYEYVDGEKLERNIADVLLEDDLTKAILKLNPWISDDNIKQVIRLLSNPKNTDLMLINQEIWTYYVKGIPVMQDL